MDQAIAPYRGALAPDVLARMRELLADALATHPVASSLVDRGRPRTNDGVSDDFEKGTLQPVRKPAKPGTSGKGDGT